jgi:hypothetical protein
MQPGATGQPYSGTPKGRLADGMGPFYREACSDDLGDSIEEAIRALTR